MADLPQGTLARRRAVLVCCALFSFAQRVVGQDAPPSAIPNLGWTPVAVGLGLVGLSFFLDSPIARDVQANSTAGSRATAKTLNRFGQVEVLAPVAGGLLVVGLVAHRPGITRTAGRLVGALVVANLLTQPAKYLFGRSRPYQDSDLDALDFSPFSGRTSFPSGHTAAAFALATTLGDASGSGAAKVALYTLATGTAWGRVTESDHWLSDVLTGAGLGVLSAKFSSGRLRVFGLRPPKMLIGPRGSELSWTVGLPIVR